MASRFEQYVHEVEGGFVVAEWDAARAQYTTTDVPRRITKHVTGYRYTFARTLRGIASEATIRPTREAALRAARRIHGEAAALCGDLREW